MDFPFEGIPTVPPRKDMDHMVGTFEHARCSSWSARPGPHLTCMWTTGVFLWRMPLSSHCIP